MLTEEEARQAALKVIPNGRIEAVVSYKNLYLLQIFRDDDALEGEFDPFYSVDKETGFFQDFSIFEDGNMPEIVALFQEAKRNSNKGT